MELSNQVVVITGASAGLGKALAEVFAREGAQLVLSSRDEKPLRAVADALHATPIVADVTRETDVRALAETTITQKGRIDVWINNAGTWTPYAPVEDIEVATAHRLMEVNYFGTFYGSREALRHMKQSGKGTLINILSARPLHPRAGSSAYCASKSAAMGLTKTVRLEAASHAVQVIGVYPERMRTDLFAAQVPDDYGNFMDPARVAEKIVANLKISDPELDLVIETV